jgi:integrase/recombinase XerD
VCALRFFYGVTLGSAEIPERIVYARSPRTLPVVLSADEVVRFLEAVPSLKTRTALTTAYAAGLRASETVGLKVGNIDSGRGVIRVEHGKGGKDRMVMLSAQLLRILAERLVGGDEHGSPLVAGADEFEQHAGLGLPW